MKSLIWQLNLYGFSKNDKLFKDLLHYLSFWKKKTTSLLIKVFQHFHLLAICKMKSCDLESMFTDVAKTEFELKLTNRWKVLFFEVENSRRLKYWMFKKLSPQCETRYKSWSYLKWYLLYIYNIFLVEDHILSNMLPVKLLMEVFYLMLFNRFQYRNTFL